MDKSITLSFTVDGIEHLKILDAAFIDAHQKCSFVLAYDAMNNGEVLKGETSGLSLDDFELMMMAVEKKTIFQESDMGSLMATQ